MPSILPTEITNALFVREIFLRFSKINPPKNTELKIEICPPPSTLSHTLEDDSPPTSQQFVPIILFHVAKTSACSQTGERSFSFPLVLLRINLRHVEKGLLTTTANYQTREIIKVNF